jgi:hypothetical protein
MDRSISTKDLGESCGHEEWEENGPGDHEDMARFHAACFKIRCLRCGTNGFCVDDTGDLWEDHDY